MNIQKNFIIFILIFLFTLPQLWAVVEIKIYIEPEFSFGDTVSFNYTIESDASQSISYTSWIECSTAPIPMLEIKTATLLSGVPLYESKNYLYISKDIEPQECTAYVYISNPLNQTVSKDFIINTNHSFNFELKIEKKVYTIGEDVNIDYISNLESPLIKANLIYPDNSIQNINLPYSFKTDSIGNYYIEVNVSKEGYKAILVNEQFGVIEEDVVIEYTELNKEEEGVNVENTQNNKKILTNRILLYSGFILGVIALLIIIIEIVKRRKYNKNIN